MSPAERLVLLLCADTLLATGGYTPLAQLDELKLRLRTAREAIEAEAYAEHDAARPLRAQKGSPG